jgi:hypothetical protein
MKLVDRIHQRIDRGELPASRPPKVQTGFGGEQACAACDKLIFPAQVCWTIEREGHHVASFHIGCFGLWDAELRRRGIAGEETLADRFKAALRDSAPGGYCFPCVAAKLTIPTEELLDAARLFVLDRSIRVYQGACHACHRWEQVIRFIPPRS